MLWVGRQPLKHCRYRHLGAGHYYRHLSKQEQLCLFITSILKHSTWASVTRRNLHEEVSTWVGALKSLSSLCLLISWTVLQASVDSSIKSHWTILSNLVGYFWQTPLNNSVKPYRAILLNLIKQFWQTTLAGLTSFIRQFCQTPLASSVKHHWLVLSNTIG